MTPTATTSRIALRTWVTVWSLLLALAVVGIASVCLGVADRGTFDFSPIEATRALVGDATADAYLVIIYYRLPATLVAMLAGACLALAGALSQGIFRNPLAAPSVIGITTGGGLGGIVSILLHLPESPAVGLALITAPAWLLTPACAFVGASLTALLVYRLATRRGDTHVPTLLLAGIAVTALTGALSSLIMSISIGRFATYQRMFLWQMGGLEYLHWEHVAMLVPGLLLGSIGAVMMARELNMLALGERSAASLGVDTQRVKTRCLLLVALMAGSAVSAIGLVGFIGLVVPHIMRRLVGPDHRILLPACALGGALFLTLMDLLQRLVVVRLLHLPELRVGALMGLIGGAFFVWLLVRQRARDSAV
ncbi:MAG: FecCD family ABC transporter permease [Planctomycetota bacterium]